jgi:hypothetical protein
MEGIMSKTNDTSNLGRVTQDRELPDDELDAVSGGLYVNPIVGILLCVVLPAVKSVLEAK